MPLIREQNFSIKMVHEHELLPFLLIHYITILATMPLLEVSRSSPHCAVAEPRFLSYRDARNVYLVGQKFGVGLVHPGKDENIQIVKLLSAWRPRHSHSG